MAEGRSVQVKRDRQVIRMKRLHLPLDHVDHTEERIGRKTVPIGERAHAVKCTVENTVPIHRK